MTLGDLLLCMRKACCCWKKLRTRSYENFNWFCYDWQIIIKQELTWVTNLTVGWNGRKCWEFKLMLKCHCAMLLGIWNMHNWWCWETSCTQKNNENTRFLVKSRQIMFYIHVLKVYVNNWLNEIQTLMYIWNSIFNLIWFKAICRCANVYVLQGSILINSLKCDKCFHLQFNFFFFFILCAFFHEYLIVSIFSIRITF